MKIVKRGGSAPDLGWRAVFDVARIRTAYPALADGYAYLDGAAGTQVPDDGHRRDRRRLPRPASATSAARSRPATARTRSSPSAAPAVADLVGGQPGRGHPRPEHDHPHLPARRGAVARAGSRATRSWCPGSTTTPTSGRGCRPPRGPARRCAGPRSTWPPASCPPGSTAALVGERTRLVAVTAASNVLGTRPDVAAITAPAHAPARWSTWTACTPPRTGRWTWRRSAPTSTPPAPTSGPARTSARWSPTRPCSTTLQPGQARPRARRGARPVRAGHRAVRRPRRGRRRGGAPGLARRRARPAPAGSGCWPRWPPPRSYEPELFAGLLGGLAAMPARDALRRGRPADRDRVLHRRRPHAAGGRRAPGRPPGERLERPQLRLGAGRRARHARRGRRRPRRPGALQRRQDVDRLLAALAVLPVGT